MVLLENANVGNGGNWVLWEERLGSSYNDSQG